MRRLTSTFFLFLISIFIFSFAESNAQYKINEGFDGTTFPPDGWYRQNVAGPVEWVRSTAQFRTGVASAFSNYDASGASMDWLVSKRFVPGATDSLTFYARRQYSSNYPPDSLLVFISNTDSLTTSFSTILVQFNTNDLTSGVWNKFTVPVNLFAGQTCWIGFRHQNTDGNGIYIDDITVGQPVLNDVGVTANIAPTGIYFVNPATVVTPSATIRNFGLLPQLVPFGITYQITGPTGLVTSTTDTLSAGASRTITFPNTFDMSIAGTYNVTIYTSLASDEDRTNDTLKTTFTVGVPKPVVILNADQRSTDSLMTHMNASGYAGQYDVLTTLPNVSFNAWKTLVLLLPDGSGWNAVLRDSMKAFLDNSTIGADKKTLMIFGNDLGYNYDPRRNASALPADTLFYRQYMRAMYWGDNWLSTITAADSGFTGVNDFAGLTNNFVTGNYPDFVMAVNGGIPAFVPNSLTGTDTTNAVYYGSPSTPYNMFYGTNQYWAYRGATDVVSEAPINVFASIADWVEASGGVLPVELASFSANVIERNVNLSWVTSEELNNSGFEIERKSTDGSWSKVGFVEGNGTTHQSSSYSFVDRGLNTGSYNYRLKQIDFNGNFEYHNLVSQVNVGIPNKFDLSQNYPNPFNPVTKINYDLPLDGKILLKVYDITGREVAQLVNEIQTAGYYTVQFNASSFASGVYFYRLFANGNNGQQYQMTKKMMLVK